MKSSIRCLLASALVLAACASASAGPYAQLSSTDTQPGATTPKVITLNQDDALKGITNVKGTITFKEAGAYFVMAAAQVGSTDAGGTGAIRLWMRQNGKDIDNSNTEQSITGKYTAVLVCQGVAEIKAGDKLELVFSVSKDGEGLGIMASKPKGEPVIPSMIFSAFKVDDATYAQLSSGVTQLGGAAPKTVTLNNVDAAKEMTNDNGVVTVKKAGTYFVMAAGQVGSPKASGKGTVRLWVRQNGKDVDNSNTEQSINGNFTAVLACQGIMECKAGDKIELMQSASDGGLGMVASTPKGEPVVPSMILSIVRIDDAAYAQLSSTETQPAGPEAAVITLNQTDAGKEIVNDKGAITVKKAGTYFAIAAGQTGSYKSDGKGSTRLWVRQNGKDVDNSNTEQTLPGNFTAVLVCQGIGEVKAGDRLQLAQSGRGSGVGLVASRPNGEPVVPSMIFSLIKVD
jgi:hypothetical protein